MGQALIFSSKLAVRNYYNTGTWRALVLSDYLSFVSGHTTQRWSLRSAVTQKRKGNTQQQLRGQEDVQGVTKQTEAVLPLRSADSFSRPGHQVASMTKRTHCCTVCRDPPPHRGRHCRPASSPTWRNEAVREQSWSNFSSAAVSGSIGRLQTAILCHYWQGAFKGQSLR